MPSSARGREQRPRVPASENALVVLVSLHLVFLPWALGAMHLWSQAVSLCLAAAGLALAAVRRPDSDGTAAGRRPILELRRFPGFWIGAFFSLFIVLQTTNPSWRYVTGPDSWWLEPVVHLPWLPTSVEVPAAMSGPWRTLVVFLSLWFVVCSVWTGLRHRRSYRALFTVLIANTLLLAVLGILQQLTDARKIFWSYTPSNLSFVSSFIYRNHAGAYFNLMVGLACGLAWWRFRRSERRLDPSSPAIFFAFVAVLAALMVVFSYSRMSIVLLLLFMAGVGGVVGLRLWTSADVDRFRTERWLVGVLFAGLLVVGVGALRVDKVWQRFAGLMADPVASARDRNLAREAALDMFADRWALGWGGGGFRHGFPLYAQHYPEIYVSDTGTLKYWEHAHNDLLEMLVEFGLVGGLAVAALLGAAVWSLLRGRFWVHPLILPIVIALGLVFVHAGVDFVFRSPAVLITSGLLLVSALRCLELDRSPSSAPDVPPVQG